MNTFSDVQVGQCFLTVLGNVCQRTGENHLVRLFNQVGEPCVWFRPANLNEVIGTILPLGVNF